MPKPSCLLSGLDFGEGPRWHDGRLFYSDFFQHRVGAVDLRGSDTTIVEVDGQPSGLGWLPDGSLLIVSMLDRRVLRFDGRRLALHADLGGIASFHTNDMVVDAKGNAYVGNFGFDLHSGSPPVDAALALVRPDGSSEVAAEGLRFPNGSVISPDGRTLIVGETLGSRYTAFDIGSDARLHGRRVWAELPGHFPDGCTLDADGGIWFADPVRSGFFRVVEGGEITDRVESDQPAFACMLGGDDGRTLFLLSASDSHPEKAVPGSGRIDTLRVDAPRAGWP